MVEFTVLRHVPGHQSFCGVFPCFGSAAAGAELGMKASNSFVRVDIYIVPVVVGQFVHPTKTLGACARLVKDGDIVKMIMSDGTELYTKKVEEL